MIYGHLGVIPLQWLPFGVLRSHQKTAHSTPGTQDPRSRIPRRCTVGTHQKAQEEWDENQGLGETVDEFWEEKIEAYSPWN